MQSADIGPVLHREQPSTALGESSVAQKGGEEQEVHEWIAMNGLEAADTYIPSIGKNPVRILGRRYNLRM